MVWSQSCSQLSFASPNILRLGGPNLNRLRMSSSTPPTKVGGSMMEEQQWMRAFEFSCEL